MVRTLLAEFWASPSVLTLVFVEFEGISHHKVHFFAVLMPSLRVIKGRGILEEHSQTCIRIRCPFKVDLHYDLGFVTPAGAVLPQSGAFFPLPVCFSQKVINGFYRIFQGMLVLGPGRSGKGPRLLCMLCNLSLVFIIDDKFSLSFSKGGEENRTYTCAQVLLAFF